MRLLLATFAILAALTFALPALGEDIELGTIGTGKGWFHADCAYSHRAPDDPIVFPRGPGASHSHDFLGARNLTAFSTNATIRKAPTTCVREGFPGTDRSAYWAPTLYVDDEPVAPVNATAGYSAGFRDVQAIEPYPDDLRIIVGDAKGNTPGGYQWRCQQTVTPGTATTAPTCATERLDLAFRFPDCWNGVDSDSADHKSHMAFSAQTASGSPGRSCPSTHPVLVPELQFTLRYPTTGGPSTRLASGAITTAHADFLNGWDPDKLAALVQRCMVADRYCGGTDRPVPGH